MCSRCWTLNRGPARAPARMSEVLIAVDTGIHTYLSITDICVARASWKPLWRSSPTASVFAGLLCSNLSMDRLPSGTNNNFNLARNRNTRPSAGSTACGAKERDQSVLGSSWCYSWCDHFDSRAKHYRCQLPELAQGYPHSNELPANWTHLWRSVPGSCVQQTMQAPSTMRTYELKETRNTTMSLSAGGAKGRDQLSPWVFLVLFLVGKALQMPIARVGTRIPTLKWVASQLNKSLEICAGLVCAANHAGTFHHAQVWAEGNEEHDHEPVSRWSKGERSAQTLGLLGVILGVNRKLPLLYEIRAFYCRTFWDWLAG